MMKSSKHLLPIAILGMSIVGAAALMAQDTQPMQPPQGMSPEEQAMMEAWMKYATPGHHHEILAKKAGTWEVSVKMWMAPDAPPEESVGVSRQRMIMGGRFLMDRTEGQAMGMPFEGMGISGYDNHKKKYQFVWIDNMGTGVMTGEGTVDEETMEFTYRTEALDPMTGKMRRFRGVERILSDDEWVSQMFEPGPDGKEFMSFQATYRRK